jgi:hypothetical protein
MDKENLPTNNLPAPAPLPAPAGESKSMTPEQRKTIIIAVIAGIVLLALIIGGLVFLFTTSLDNVSRIRDVFIIFMALISLLMGFTLVILMVQIARLINLLQNEIKPILDSTNETVSHLRGTTAFLGDNLVEPVIKLNEYMAGFTQLLQVIGLAKKPKKTTTPKPTEGE